MIMGKVKNSTPKVNKQETHGKIKMRSKKLLYSVHFVHNKKLKRRNNLDISSILTYK
jgi:Ribosomal protein S30